MANFSRENEGKPTGTDSADITVVTSRIDNVESALVGNLSLNLIDIDGATIDGTTVGVLGVSFTLNNNLYGDKYEIGSTDRQAIIEQQRTVEGSLNVEFDDLWLYNRFVAGTSGDLIVTLTSSELAHGSNYYQMIIRFPNIEFNGTTPTIGGPEMIVTDFPFVALYDDDGTNGEVTITVINSRAAYNTAAA